MKTKGLDQADQEMMPFLNDLEEKILAQQEMFKIRGKVGIKFTKLCILKHAWTYCHFLGIVTMVPFGNMIFRQFQIKDWQLFWLCMINQV